MAPKTTLPYGGELIMTKAMEVLLEKHKFNCQLEFPLDHGLAENATFDYMIDYASNSFRIAMRNYMFQGAKGTETFHHVPATWWDHFKQAHFPRWALDRWPVKHTKLLHTSYALCPHGADKWPHAKHIRFLYYGDERNVE
jgi:hypothetical protein